MILIPGEPERMEAEQNRAKAKRVFGTQTKPARAAWPKHLGLEPESAPPSDSAGRFRRYRCSTLFNYNSNLCMCGTFLMKLIPPQDNCRLLPTIKVKPNLNLRTWSFRAPATIFGCLVPKNCRMVVCLHALCPGNRDNQVS